MNWKKFDDLDNLDEVFAGEAYNPERDVLALSLHQYTRFNHQPKIAPPDPQILPLTQIFTPGPTFLTSNPNSAPTQVCFMQTKMLSL